MRKTALLAKPAAPRGEALDQAALRRTIAEIIQSEYSGDIDDGIWGQAARRAADRIMRVICSSAHEITRP